MTTDEQYAYLLVEHEKWWNTRHDKNQKGLTTQAFVRRGKVGPKDASQLLFYVKLPVGEIRGYGVFLERISGNPDELWRMHGAETAFETQNDYNAFVEGRNNVTFIRFKNLHTMQKPISWKELSTILGIKKMPNGGRYLSRETVNSLLSSEL